jgi:hypothetical protein
VRLLDMRSDAEFLHCKKRFAVFPLIMEKPLTFFDSVS